MKYRKETTAICYDESLLKQSALFHTHVIPLKVFNISEKMVVLSDILPPGLNSKQLIDIYQFAENRTEDYLDYEMVSFPSIESEIEHELEWQLSYLIDFHRRITPLPICATHGRVPSYYYDANTELNEPWPADFHVDHIFGAPEWRGSNRKEIDSLEPAIILSNLDLIDANQLTWDQITEIRKDQNSMNALRDLRMFMYREFKNEDSQAYIEDVLLQLMRRYKETADKWGFDTMQQTLKIGLNKAMILGIGSSLAAVLFQATLPTAVAAGFAACIGQIAIKFSERHKEKIEVQRNDPAHYLIEVEKQASVK